jgi:hypothetical protein
LEPVDARRVLTILAARIDSSCTVKSSVDNPLIELFQITLMHILSAKTSAKRKSISDFNKKSQVASSVSEIHIREDFHSLFPTSKFEGPFFGLIWTIHNIKQK